MLRWIVLLLMVLAANGLLAFAMNGAAKAFRDWGASSAAKLRTARSSSPSRA